MILGTVYTGDLIYMTIAYLVVLALVIFTIVLLIKLLKR